MDQRLSVSEFRKGASEALNRVAYQGSRIVLHRRNKDVAVLVSVEDAAFLQELEDREDLEDARQAMKEYRESGEIGSTLEEIAEECGIELRGSPSQR
jgi:prevent-host-death family protein